jgi:Phage integrase, N-terminal SAM-like domain
MGGGCLVQPRPEGDSRHLPTFAAAKAWREDASTKVRQNKMRAAAPTTLAEEAEQFIADLRTGAIRTRAGHPYKPGVIRHYERRLRLRVLPEFGRRKLASIEHRELQRFVEDMLAEGVSPTMVTARARHLAELAAAMISVVSPSGIRMRQKGTPGLPSFLPRGAVLPAPRPLSGRARPSRSSTEVSVI